MAARILADSAMHLDPRLNFVAHVRHGRSTVVGARHQSAH